MTIAGFGDETENTGLSSVLDNLNNFESFNSLQLYFLCRRFPHIIKLCMYVVALKYKESRKRVYSSHHIVKLNCIQAVNVSNPEAFTINDTLTSNWSLTLSTCPRLTAKIGSFVEALVGSWSMTELYPGW